MTHVDSSAMTDIGHLEAERTLRIRFESGWYRSIDVPPDEAAGLLAAGSHGRYLQDHIRDGYAYERE
jgi:hypothetical protein